MNNPHKPPCIHPLLYLPGSETGGAHEMTTGLNLHILVVLGTDLTKLESGAHLTVELVLLLHRETRERGRPLNTGCSCYSHPVEIHS